MIERLFIKVVRSQFNPDSEGLPRDVIVEWLRTKADQRVVVAIEEQYVPFRTIEMNRQCGGCVSEELRNELMAWLTQNGWSVEKL
jgi:hypothetical protein